MNNTFSFKRIGLMLRADWFAYKKRLSFMLGMAFLAFLYITYISELKQQSVFFLFGLFLAFLIYCSNCLDSKLHDFTEQFLTLPTFYFEKYIEILLIGAIHIIAYSAIYILALYINHIFTGIEIVTVAQLLTFIGSWYGVIFFLWNYVFIMYVFFKRFGLQVAILSLIIIIGFAFFIETKLPETIVKPMVDFSLNYYNPILFVLGIGLLCVAYWKIKVKQIG